MQIRRNAYISKDGLYRYWLLREWDDSKPLVAFIGINPSKADAKKDDHTIRKEIGFAKRWGYGSLIALNVGAFRSTDVKLWYKAADPIGPENTIKDLNRYIRKFNVTRVIAAWGTNGNYCIERCNEIANEIPDLWCLGINGDGSPKHPCMVSYEVECQRYTA